jgi:putative redox protein
VTNSVDSNTDSQLPLAHQSKRGALSLDMKVTFPGGKKVDALYGGYTVKTDQPESNGGAGDDPSPFDLFFASIGTCVGYYVLSFCQKRDIAADQIELDIRMDKNDDTGLIGHMVFDIRLPAEFPEKYRTAITKATDQCKVKMHLDHPPTFEITARVAESIPEVS